MKNFLVWMFIFSSGVVASGLFQIDPIIELTTNDNSSVKARYYFEPTGRLERTASEFYVQTEIAKALGKPLPSPPPVMPTPTPTPRPTAIPSPSPVPTAQPSPVGLYLLNTPAASGRTLTVKWFAPSVHSAKDWVGLYKAGASDTQFIAWKYISGGTTGTLTLTAVTSGEYELRMFRDDGFSRVATSSRITLP